MFADITIGLVLGGRHIIHTLKDFFAFYVLYLSDCHLNLALIIIILLITIIKSANESQSEEDYLSREESEVGRYIPSLVLYYKICRSI